MEKKKSNVVAIVTMIFIFAMISFVTNMAAPFGNIWKNHYEWAGMLGNMFWAKTKSGKINVLKNIVERHR